MIDIKKDINFRYIFGKDSEPNKIALSGLIEAFTEEKVDNLKILSNELSINMENAKETRLDILASFGSGEKIDVEMQMYNNKYELIERMTFYAGQLISNQVIKGEDYSRLKRCYVLFILNFKWFEDNQLVHVFLKKDKWTNSLLDKDFSPFVIVELPKVEYKEEMSVQEEYAFVLKNCTEEKYRDKIEEIKQREKGIFYMMECANDISQNEKEWLEKIEEIRKDLDRNQRITNARLEGKMEGRIEGIEIGIKNVIHTMYEKNQDIEFIAQMVNQSVEYVQSVLNEK